MPKVSVIIPFKSGEFFLIDCLESLKAQTFTDYEVLLVLDGYSGNINNTIDKYKNDMTIRVLSTSQGGNGGHDHHTGTEQSGDGTHHTGVAAARNVGIENAEGEFVYFLDADDYIFEDAIQVLLEAAEETNEDMVYGKFHYTYYKRDIFLPIYIEKREAMIAANEAAAEEQSGNDGNSGSDADSDEDDDEGDDEGDDEEELDEKEYTEEELALREYRRRFKARRKAVRRLITRKKRFRNVSVLHKLFRKSKLDELGLRFDESMTYYCDFPFMAEFLDHEVNVRKRYHAHYIKRKHQDPINNPALSQLQDERRFEQMMAMFNGVIDEIDPLATVRRAVDHQIIIYFTNYFVKKLKRSENECWREERFDAMRELALRISTTNIRREKFWRRRMVKALRNGQQDKCVKLITRRLGWKKFKKMLRGKNVLNKFLYRRKYLKMPISENTIVFESFLGKNYSDSPKYIYEYLAKNYPDKFNYVWVLDNDTKLPYGGTKVKRFSRRYMKYMATAKYFVFNMRQPTWYKKRKGMVFLETWHGTPLKKLVFDLDEVYSASPLYKKEVYKQSREWDYLIAANEFSSRVFKSCFMFDNPMLEYGYPRNDLLHSPDRDKIAEELREKLGIPKYKKTILYAPTWRDDEYYGKGKYKFELKLDLEAMRKELSDEYVVLLRTHYFIADALDLTGLEGFAFNFSKYNDITDLYLISDIIITDYSSVFFDYSNLKRPMLFYTYDLEKYRDVLRGFYIDIEEELPGPLLFTTEEVIDAIKNIDAVNAKYADKYAVFYERYCGWEDGHAAENVAKKVFGL
ncbi:MAG: bifunctional glycosyltransferase family 2 protein/CDP-glycerol:glycerophosphate glycerophosphotransferase [Lachnospiraceae bacterium]|nr:bifunctional glycosyltransferase family 2 protein/CDP-glycerol:glycerophosphate glycerophosphotransferase [Lachnospiraceae bacterium]